MTPILLAISLLFGQLGAYSPVPGVYLYVHDIVIGVIFLHYFYRHHGLRITDYALRLPIFAFLTACVLSIVVNIFRLEPMELVKSFLYVARWGYYAMLYVVIAQDRKPMRWLHALFATGVGFAVLGLIQFVLYPDLRNLTYLGWDPHFYRVFSTLLDPNFTGIIMVLTLFLGWGMWPSYARASAGERSWEVKGIMALIAVTLILTFSRSSILGLLAGLAVWTVYAKKYVWFWLGIAVLAVAILIPKPGGDNLSFFRKDSSIARVINWQQGWELVRQAPIVGHGFYALPMDLVVGRQGDDAIVTRAAAYLDNSLLFVLASTGIVGFAAYLWLLNRQRDVISTVGKKHPELMLAGWASMAALFAHSLFVNSLFYAWTMIWMWVVLGAITSSTNNANIRMRTNATNKKK